MQTSTKIDNLNANDSFDVHEKLDSLRSMPVQPRLSPLICLALMCVCVVFAGCGGLWMSASAEKQATLAVPAPTGKLVVEGFNGSITIVGTDDVTDVQVEATIRASGRDAAELSSKSVGDSLTVFVDRPSEFSGSVSYKIRMPTRIAVSANTSNGEVDVQSTHAQVEVASSNGSISVSEVSERIEAKTSNASIRVTNSSPIAVDLKTSNGSVSVTAALAGQENRIVTSNAQVEAALSGAPVSVSYQTSNASVMVDSSKREPKGKAELGGASTNNEGEGNRLTIQTSNGGITLSHSQ